MSGSETTWGVAVLAAGQGTRMRSTVPKVLHHLEGRALVDWVLDLALGCAAPSSVAVVVGHGGERVAGHVRPRGVRVALQQPQLGTGDALRVALEALAEDGLPPAVLVLSGDVPLLRPETLRRLQVALEEGVAAVLLTARLDAPAAYGRVLRDEGGEVTAVVEARDASEDVLRVNEVNAGVYALRPGPVLEVLPELTADNRQGELYLTDLPPLLRRRGLAVRAVELDDPGEMTGVNSRVDLAAVAAILNRRTLERIMAAGVTVVDPATTRVESACIVEQDALLEPGVVLRGGCRVGRGARIGAHAVVDGVEVEPGEVVPPLSHRGC